MIIGFTGSPGSGKSLHKAYFIYDTVLNGKKKIIHNKWIDTDLLAKKLGKKNGKDRVAERYLFIDTKDLTPMILIDFAKKYHTGKDEGETVLIIEEAADIFHKDEFKNNRYYFTWLKWMREHRQYGFDVYLIVQDLAILHPDIRKCMEIEINHRNVKNYKIIGRVLSFIFGGFFSYSQRWIAVKPTLWDKGGTFVLHRRKAKIYETMEVMRDIDKSKKKEKHVKIGGFAEDYLKPKLLQKAPAADSVPPKQPITG